MEEIARFEVWTRAGGAGRSRLSSSSSASSSSTTTTTTTSTDSSSCSSPSFPGMTARARQWRQRAEDVVWVGSAVFILYYGDLHSNFFSLLANDPRIRRGPLHIGSICLLVDFVLLLNLAISLQTKHEKLDILILNAIQAPTILGFVAFIFLSTALWPIWSILTIPMLFTLFMASVVMFPYLLPYMDVKMDLESLRHLLISS